MLNVASLYYAMCMAYRFSVFHRTSCPLTEQPFHQSCAPGESLLVYEGMNTSVWIRNLLPYIAYQFMLVVTNEVGQVGFPQWVNATTDSSGCSVVKLFYKYCWLAGMSLLFDY